ncbi:MAG: hypothetical protein ABSE82_12440, partial [Nitrososphaerales archaeon]
RPHAFRGLGWLTCPAEHRSAVFREQQGILILQAQENKGQTRAGVRTGRDGICTPLWNRLAGQ